MIKIGFSGLTGMIGRNVLLEAEHTPAVKNEFVWIAFARRSSTLEFLKEHGVEVRTVDFADAASFAGKLADLDVFMHFAGLAKAVRPRQFYEVNTELTVRLLQAIERYGKNIRHFLFSSSTAASGPAASPEALKAEGEPCQPVSDYGKSKLLAEQAIRSLGFNWTILRFPPVLGPYDHDGLSIFRMAKSRLIGTFGPSDDYFSHIFAQDAARLLFRLPLNERAFGATFNVCYDRPVKALDFYSAVRHELGMPPGFLYLHCPRWLGYPAIVILAMKQRLTKKATIVSPDKLKELMVKYWVYSNERLKQALELTSITESGAFSSTVQWYRERGLL